MAINSVVVDVVRGAAAVASHVGSTSCKASQTVEGAVAGCASVVTDSTNKQSTILVVITSRTNAFAGTIKVAETTTQAGNTSC